MQEVWGQIFKPTVKIRHVCGWILFPANHRHQTLKPCQWKAVYHSLVHPQTHRSRLRVLHGWKIQKKPSSPLSFRPISNSLLAKGWSLSPQGFLRDKPQQLCTPGKDLIYAWDLRSCVSLPQRFSSTSTMTSYWEDERVPWDPEKSI